MKIEGFRHLLPDDRGRERGVLPIPAHTGMGSGWCPKCCRDGCDPDYVGTWDEDTAVHERPKVQP